MESATKVFRSRKDLSTIQHNILLEDIIKMKKKWTTYEHDFLRRNLRSMTIEEMSDALGRTVCGVSKKLSRLYRVDLERKSPKSANRHHLNHDKLYADSDELFYLLGFIAADGNVCKRNNAITIRLAIKDRHILDDIKNWLEYTGAIRSESHSGFNKEGQSVVLTIYDKHLKNILLHYGIGPNKSKTIRLLNRIPNEFIGSFVRGVFDGDGSVCKSKDNHFVISICCKSKAFLENLRDLMEFGKISTNKNDMHLLYIRSYEKRRFFELIYNKPRLYLNRKYIRMEEAYTYVVRNNWQHRIRNKLGQFAGKET